MTGFRNKVWIIIAIFLVASLLTGAIFLVVKLKELQPVEISLENTTKADVLCDVCISGAVARPGIYPARSGDSLASLISAAGLSDSADTGHISIHIPVKGKARQPQKVDLNAADAWLLQALPGVGEGKARLIVAYRDKNGPLHSVDDLLKIEGFGESFVTKIREYATVGD